MNPSPILTPSGSRCLTAPVSPRKKSMCSRSIMMLFGSRYSPMSVASGLSFGSIVKTACPKHSMNSSRRTRRWREPVTGPKETTVEETLHETGEGHECQKHQLQLVDGCNFRLRPLDKKCKIYTVIDLSKKIEFSKRFPSLESVFMIFALSIIKEGRRSSTWRDIESSVVVQRI